ncbi:MAG: polyphosphate kinase 2 family protein [Mariniphaga sp.]
MDYNKYIFPADRSKKLSDFRTDDKNSYTTQKSAEESLKQGVEQLSEIQNVLYAQDKFSLLIIFQAMDAAGKDSTIKHVMSGINPQGCNVTSFKAPSTEELDHAYLWRCMKATPAKGDIGIFNRSYYEEVLVTRVHPEILAGQKLPIDYSKVSPDHSLWLQRYNDINNFEKYLSNNGTLILKFFLNVSKEEQKRRFLKRIEDPEKNWKFSDRDVEERKYWDDYQTAYEQTFIHTSTALAPWYIIPADHKWFMQIVVSQIIVEKLNSLGIEYPKLTSAQRDNIEKGKQLLLEE